MNGNLSSVPPQPSAQVLEQLFALIGLITNPKAAKAMLEDLSTRTAQLAAATAANEQAAKVAKDELNAVENLKRDQQKLAADQEDLRKAKLSIDNMAAGLEAREQKILAAEAALKTKQDEHAANVASLNARVADMRSALA
jgi:chromosome condensin MukBEF ATPase and DNA-binding subunit MukB